MALDPFFYNVVSQYSPSRATSDGTVFLGDESPLNSKYIKSYPYREYSFPLATSSLPYGGTGRVFSFPDDTMRTIIFLRYNETPILSSSVADHSKLTNELWLYRISNSPPVVTLGISKYFSSGNASYYYDIFVDTDGEIKLASFDLSSGLVTTTLSIPLSSWTHLAITLDGTVLKVYINGVLASTRTFDYNYSYPTSETIIETQVLGSPSIALNTHVLIGDIRSTRAIRYTSNFTPPTEAFPQYAGNINSEVAYGYDIYRQYPDLSTTYSYRYDILNLIPDPYKKIYLADYNLLSSNIVTTATLTISQIVGILNNTTISPKAYTTKSLASMLNILTTDFIRNRVSKAFYDLFRIENPITPESASLYAQLISNLKINSAIGSASTEEIEETILFLSGISFINEKLMILIDTMKVSSTLSKRIEVVNTVISLINALENSYPVFMESMTSYIEYQGVAQSIYKTLTESIDELLISYDLSNSLDIILLTSSDLGISENLSSSRILNMLLSSDLILRLQPNKDALNEYSTYLYSPETASVSTYSNYSFDNSAYFNKDYLFSNSTGLFLYGGNTDNGNAIRSTIRTPAYDFSTTNLKQVPTVYLGLTTDNILLLKVRVDSKSEATYKLNKRTKHLQTEKIDIGKGNIGRYFQFELISDANEFAMESIEFYPLVLNRKL